MDEMNLALERAEIGWDRDKARGTLAESMQTIEIASRLARKAVTEIDGAAIDIAADVEALKEIISDMQAEGISSGKTSGTCTRRQANAILTVCNRLVRAFDVKEIVRMSLDLTNQSRIFVDMMDRVDKRYGEEDRKRAEDITEHLTTEQLLQVLAWVGENKEAKSVGVE